MAHQLANHIVPDYPPDSVYKLEKRINDHLESLELEPIYLTNKPLMEVMSMGSTSQSTMPADIIVVGDVVTDRSHKK